MFKHFPHKHFKKKHHPKDVNKIQIEKTKESIPPFVAFGLSFLGLLFLLLPLLIGIWAFIAFETKYNDRFYPGVFIGSESIGGQTYDEALGHFKEKAEELQKNGLNVSFETSKGIQNINIPISTTGLTSDNSVEYFTLDEWENDLKEAYAWGHEKNIFRRLKEQFSLLFVRKNFKFSISIQNEAVNSLLENDLSGFLKKNLPARFSSTENKISILKEETGETIDKEEILNILEKKLNQFDTSSTVFKTEIDIPTITQEDLSPFLVFAENFSQKTNFVFQYKGHEWKIAGPKLVTWLTINKEGKIDIDNTKLNDYFSTTVTKFINNPPQNSRFEIQNGKLIEIAPGKPGNIIDIENIVQKIEKIIHESEMNLDTLNNIQYLPIETIQVEPKITKETISKYQIRDLVGEIRTSFNGSSKDREHNIKIGVAAINGILIAPGAEFYTVSSIGSVTGKKGYVKETVIKENKTTKEFGGGLCQVATTLFRLALNAGLSITERMNHRFVIGYYNPPGLDATIYGPHPDLSFVNDTGGFLLLQARVENKQVIMELYGQKDGRSVEISKPYIHDKIPAPKTKYIQSKDIPVGKTQCTETPHDGVTTEVLYSVKYQDGTTKKRIFKSIYQPWQKVCLVGTALTR